MNKRKVFFLSILTTFLVLMLPHIPAIDFTITKETVSHIASQSAPFEKIKDKKLSSFFNQEKIDIQKITPLFNLIEKISSHVKTDEEVNSILGTLLRFILSIIILILNILITTISIISGLANTLFSLTINFIVRIIKSILNLSSILQRIIDIIASIVTGLFGIALNLVVGLLTLIKDIIVNLIKPSVTTSF